MNNNQLVKELRKEGKLDEALILALEELKTNPENIWSKRSISWVYYEFLKGASERNDYLSFIDYLNKVIDLELNDEKMLMDNLIWPINKMFYQLSSQSPIDYNKSEELLQKIKQLNLEKPSTNFSILIKALHKTFKDSPLYISLIDWIGFENLMDQDFLEEEYNNRKNMATAELVYINYAKHLEQGIALDAFGQQREYDLVKIKKFIPKLEQLIFNYPNYTFPPYFKAKLLLRLGDGDIMKSFLPFAKQKRNDYWVWQLISEIHKKDIDIVFSSLAKALSLKTPDNFLVKIRQNFVQILIQKQMFNEAKFEIINIVNTKERDGHKIPNQVIEWQNSEWFRNSVAPKNNYSLYNNLKIKAEELLFQDIPKEKAVIDYINTDKNMISFLINKNKKGFFKYENVKKFSIGDIIDIQFNGDPKEEFYKVYAVNKSQNLTHDFLKIINGKIRIIPSGIGFVEDVFVDKSIIETRDIIEGQLIRGKAILSFNKKKNEWGWKLIYLTEK